MLDFYTLKPYFTLKNLLIYAGMAVFFGFTSKNVFAMNGALFMMIGINVLSLFAVGEQNGIDALYLTLPLDREKVVKGRYVFTFLLCIIMGIVGGIFTSLFGFAFFPGFSFADVGENAVSIVALLLVYLVILMVQLPIFFRMGYQKAKGYAMLPFFLPAVIIALIALGRENFHLPVPKGIFLWAIILIGVIVITLLPFISYKLAKKWYYLREF